MPQHKLIEVWLKCGGKVVEEFGGRVDANDANLYTCWVASEAGKCFTVHWESQMVGMDLEIHTVVDGIKASKKVMNGRMTNTSACLGVRASDSTIRPLVFSDAKLSDDDSLLNEQPPNVGNIGEIMIKVYLISITGKRRRARFKGGFEFHDGPIHERTKKGGGHRVTLGEEVPRRRITRNSYTYTVSPLDPNKLEPYVAFRLDYRPYAFLQAQGILIIQNPLPSDDPHSPSRDRKLPYPDRGAGQPSSSKSGAITSESEKGKRALNRTEDEDVQYSADGEGESAILEQQMQQMQQKILKLQRKCIKHEQKFLDISAANQSGGLIDLTLD